MFRLALFFLPHVLCAVRKGVSDGRWHDSFYSYYIDQELCRRLLETDPMLCLGQMSEWDGIGLILVNV